MEVPIDQFKTAMDSSHGYIAATVTHPDSHFSGYQHDPALDSVSFRCQVTIYNSDRVYIDSDAVGTCNGNTFYCNSDKTAGNDDYTNHYAYNAALS